MKSGAQAAVVPSVVASAGVKPAHRAVDFLALTKPRLNFLVLFTTLGGMYIAAPEGVPAAILVHALVGTALVAGGAAALNQVWERETDSLMRRTQARPIPGGRLRVSDGTLFGVLLSATGLIELAWMVNPISAAVAAATLVSYVLVYTPLKRRTSLATLIGAVPGALPPVIGWAAATGTISPPAFVLFGIVFLWQMPHFLAIAWLYRDDYARAGIPLLPALWPVSLLPALVGIAGVPYSIVATVLGFGLIALSALFARDRTTNTARHLFLYSITYLPLLWGALVIDRLWL